MGLIGLTAVLSIGLIVLSRWVGGKWRRVQRAGIAALFFIGFVWLSPQIYYAYYRVIFDSLPAQWVIGWPPITEALRKAVFLGQANLSAHGQGLLFWVMILQALRGSERRGPVW